MPNDFFPYNREPRIQRPADYCPTHGRVQEGCQPGGCEIVRDRKTPDDDQLLCTITPEEGYTRVTINDPTAAYYAEAEEEGPIPALAIPDPRVERVCVVSRSESLDPEQIRLTFHLEGDKKHAFVFDRLLFAHLLGALEREFRRSSPTPGSRNRP